MLLSRSRLLSGGRWTPRTLLNVKNMSAVSLSNRPQNWKELAPAPLPNTTTFASQDKLPQLPVPTLPDTLVRLKEAIKPFATNNAELFAAERAIDEFGKQGGIGEVLQKRLEERAAGTKHWLESWWDDLGYLGYRDSVVINVSYYYGFDPQPKQLSQTPAGRAAGLMRAAMIFRQQLKQGLLPPDATKEGPLCMDTFRWMFDCCRVPGPKGMDWSVTYAKEGDLGNSGHIIVIRKNRVWKVEATKDGKILSLGDFEKQIQHIYDNTGRDYPGVGVLTSNNRDVWANDYATLVESEQNANIVEAIHSSAFIVSLESSEPTDLISHSRQLWHGDINSQGIPVGLRNRWVDKPTQFVVFDNAAAGVMGEHSVMDGTPMVRLCDDVLNMLADPSFDQGKSSSGLPLPESLDWKVSTATAKAIVEADKAAAALINSQTLTMHNTSYGKAAIKKFGVSPDSWAQMIVQLAYKRLIGDAPRKGATYEAATTRKFFKGRTEAIKVVTSEADAWVASMLDPQVDDVRRKELFDAATKRHVQLAKAGGQGQGVDRILLGWKQLLASGEDKPAMFTDPLIARSSYWVLSTSAVFSKHFPVYGWGEVVPDGFGVAYMTGFDERLQFTITSRTEMPNEEFKEEIAKAAVELYDLHSRLATSKAKL